MELNSSIHHIQGDKVSAHGTNTEMVSSGRDETIVDCSITADDLVNQLRAELSRRWAANGVNALQTTCQYALRPDGKLIRPLLLLEAAEAVGGNIASVIPAAVGAESGHVASLAHDDIIDGDTMRRGRPSVYAAFGVGLAIVAGDALIFDMFAGLSDCADRGADCERVVWALREVSRAGIDMCEGQALEERLTRCRQFDVDAYLQMVSLKTAAFFGSACAVGAILGNGTRAEVDALTRYGRKLGQAFQIIDDLLPYSSHADTIGKPIGSDARNGRPTLPTILARQTNSAELDHLDSLFRSGDLDEEALGRRLRTNYEAYGSIQKSRSMAEELVAEAKAALAPLPREHGKRRLRHWADLALARTR